MADPITEFRGKYFFLSNFYPSVINLDGWVFPCVENAFQAAKSTDPEDWKKIQGMAPGQAKAFGRRLKLRPNWEEIKVQVMTECLIAKFSRPDMAQRLKETGSRPLIEGNTWNDRFWGVCNGQGQNMLGKLLMEIRTQLQKG